MAFYHHIFLGLFTNLPQPKCRTNEIIEEDNVITTGQVSSSKKNPKPIKKQPVKISIPSLSNFPQEEDDIEPTAKKSKAAVIIFQGLFNQFFTFLLFSERFWFI